MSADAVGRALGDLAAGRPVLVVDDGDREDEGDFVVAAELATAESLALVVRHSTGLLCVPLEASDADRLALPPMVTDNEDPRRTAYTVSTDARHGVGTGVSAADRARTARVLAHPGTTPEDLVRPGHVLPLRAVAGGVLARRGHTEAAVDLMRLAGLRPAAVIAEVVDDDGSMARLPRLRELADELDLALISVADLVAHRRRTEVLVDRVAETVLPTRHGTFRAVAHRSRLDASESLALVLGDVADGEPVLTRVHSECLTGDALGSLRCDCGAQLDAALAAVTAAGRGVVVYLLGHEGRGIGLADKLRAYALQDAGADTVDANLALGLPADARDYTTAAHALRELGVGSVRLVTNNPAKRRALEENGVAVTALVPSATAATAENLRYLTTKRDRMGHDLTGLPEDPAGEGALLQGTGRPA